MDLHFHQIDYNKDKHHGQSKKKYEFCEIPNYTFDVFVCLSYLSICPSVCDIYIY